MAFSDSRIPRADPPNGNTQDVIPTSERNQDPVMTERMDELTTEGVSLAGVKRIIALEEELDCARDEIDRLQDQIAELRREADQAVADVHRQYRRDLVPFSKAIIRFGPR